MTDDPSEQVRRGPDPSRVVVQLSVRRNADEAPTTDLFRGPGPSTAPGAFTVDCADCAHQRSEVCDDCVVSFIVGRQPEDALVVDADEARAVRLLTRAGLVPAMRHESRVSGL